MPYKVFVAGEEALAADANSFLMSQTVPRFTNAAQRTSQLTAPVLNQLSILDSRPRVEQYWTGSAWADVAPFVQTGNVNLVPAAGVATLTFPVAFGGPPRVTANMFFGPGSNPPPIIVAVLNVITNASVQLGFTYASGGAGTPITTGVDVMWIAVGPYA